MSEQNGHATYDFLSKLERPKPVEHRIEAWGKSIWLRRVTAAEYLSLASIEDTVRQQLRGVAIALCDKDGKPFFPEPWMLTTEHAEKFVGMWDREAFEEVWAKFAEINGFAAVEELAGNSETTETSGSATS